MKEEIKVPAVGESITEAIISEWNKKSGDYVNRNEILLVLETDKANVEVVAEYAGQLSTESGEGEKVEVGAVVGFIDTDAKTPSASSPVAPATDINTSPTREEEAAGRANGHTHPSLSPAVRKIVAEKQIDPTQVSGSGKGGRLTKADVLTASSPNPMAVPPSPTSAPELPLPPQVKVDASEEVRREPMSPLRKTIATRLVQAQQTAAILTTFNEIDMTAVMELRGKYKESFKEKYGISLGFMGFFVKASVAALKEYPRVNAHIEGNDIVFKNFVNMGIAVSTEKGLVVPVIRQTDKLSLADIELSLRHYAIKARDGKIAIDDLRDGSFTISNGGVFGSLMSTPILNPPQSGILGLHKIEERPVALKGQVVIRPMMYAALSYDHRIIDGRESVGFLSKVKEGIEDPARLLLDI